MAQAKKTYRSKAEKEKALEQARKQYENAKNSMRDTYYPDFSSERSPYKSSQESAYLKMSKKQRPKVAGDEYNSKEVSAGRFANDKAEQRTNQLKRAYQNRVNAISSASVNG